MNYCLKLKVENIVKKYRYVFKNFFKWCKIFKLIIDYLLVFDVYVVLYLVYFVNIFDFFLKIEEVIYVIIWVYDMVGFFNFCDFIFVKFVKEGCIREYSYFVVKKELILLDILFVVVEKFGKSDVILYDF